MIKKLLLILLPVLFLPAGSQAQTKVWDFGTNASGFWPENPGVPAGTTVTIDNLNLFAHNSSSNFGQIEIAGAANWAEPDFAGSDLLTATQRLKLNGKGADTGVYLPTVRYLYFQVSGDVQVKVWHRVGGTGTPRSLYITDGTNLLGSFVSDGTDVPRILTANYTGGAATIYVYGADNAFNLYKIEVTGVGADVLGLEEVSTSMAPTVKAAGDRIYITHVRTASEINIYTLTGALVKSFTTNEDMNFTFDSGLYIGTIKTFEGQKSVKLLVQ